MQLYKRVSQNMKYTRPGFFIEMDINIGEIN